MKAWDDVAFRKKSIIQNMVYSDVHQAVRFEVRNKLTENGKHIYPTMSARARFQIWGPDIPTESPLETALDMTINDDMELYLSVDAGVY